MARRDNQGIQIAMIVFILTTLLFMVTTYFGYSSSTTLKGQVAQLEGDLQSANGNLSSAVTFATNLKTLVGLDGAMDDDAAHEAIRVAVQETYGQGLPAENQNFIAISEHFVKRLQDVSGQLGQSAQDNSKLQQQLAAALTDKEQTVKVHQEEAQKAHAQQIKLTDDLEQYRQQAAARQQQLTQERDKAKDDLNQLTQKTGQQTQDLQSQLDLVSRVRDEKAKQVEELLGGTPDQFDGQVLASVPSSRLVYLNVGSADGIRPRITFGIYDAEYNKARGEKAKATVEVTKVNGPHHCEARVTDQEPTEPIVRGDHIYSVVWSPGVRIGIALVGTMDIDKDGRDDREYIKNMIVLNGGKVDAEDGGEQVKGEVTFNTRYVVIGDSALDGQQNPAGQKIIEAARNLSVERMALEELLDLMGYAGRARTESYNGVLRPGDFAVEPHNDVNRSSTGTTSYGKRDATPRRDRVKSY